MKGCDFSTSDIYVLKILRHLRMAVGKDDLLRYKTGSNCISQNVALTHDDELQACLYISAEMKRNYLRNRDAIFVCPMGTADDEYR